MYTYWLLIRFVLRRVIILVGGIGGGIGALALVEQRILFEAPNAWSRRFLTDNRLTLSHKSLVRSWCGWRESNPPLKLGKLAFYR